MERRGRGEERQHTGGWSGGEEGEREGDRTKQKARGGEGDESEPGRNVGFRFDISARGGHESRDLEVEGPLRWVGPTTSCLFAGPVPSSASRSARVSPLRVSNDSFA